MNPLLLRDELPPDDTVVVMRGGEMKSEVVRRTATRLFEEFGIWAVSVFLADGVPVTESDVPMSNQRGWSALSWGLIRQYQIRGERGKIEP
jgi:hypothetical protein